MLLVATILIAIPLAVLALVGLVYIAAPRHLSYHRTVMERVGEETLAQKLNELTMSCLLGSAVVIIAVMYSQPGAESLRNVLDENATLPLLIIAALGIAGSLRPPPHTALRVRRRAGLMILGLCSMEAMVLSTGYPAGAHLAGALASALLVHVTLGTRKLGQRTGAKTPWPLLAALCVPLIIGTALAFLS